MLCYVMLYKQINSQQYQKYRITTFKRMNCPGQKSYKKSFIANKENFAPLSYTPSRKVSINQNNNQNSDLHQKQIQAKNCLYELSEDAGNTLYSSTFNNVKKRGNDEKVKAPKKYSLKQNRKAGEFSPWVQEKMKKSSKLDENTIQYQCYNKDFDDKNYYQQLQSKDVFVKKQSFNLIKKEPKTYEHFLNQEEAEQNRQPDAASLFLKDFKRPKCKTTITRYPSQKSHTTGANHLNNEEYQMNMNFEQEMRQCRISNNLSVNQKRKTNSRSKMSNHQKTQPIYQGNKNSSSELKFINQTVLIYDNSHYNNNKIHPQFEDKSLQNNIYNHVIRKMRTKDQNQNIFQPDNNNNKQNQMKKLQAYSKSKNHKYYSAAKCQNNDKNNLQNKKICIDFDKSSNKNQRNHTKQTSIKKNIDQIMQKINPSFGKTIKKDIMKAIQKECVNGFFDKNKDKDKNKTNETSNYNQFRQFIRLPKKSRPKIKCKSSLNQSMAPSSGYQTSNPLTKLLYQNYVYMISKNNRGKTSSKN